MSPRSPSADFQRLASLSPQHYVSDLESCRDEASTRVHHIHPFGLSLTCNTQSAWVPLGFSLSFAPGNYSPRTSGREPVSDTDRELRLGHLHPTSNRRTHSTRATSCRTAHRQIRCAARRLVVSPVQLGGTRREVPGSDGLPQVRKDLGGPEHARKAAAVPRRTGRCAAGPAEYGESWIARSQISRRCKPTSTGKTSDPVPCPALVSQICRRNLRGIGRCPVRAFKEMSWPPTFRSTRTTGTNAGSPTGRESFGDGGLVVVGAP